MIKFNNDSKMTWLLKATDPKHKNETLRLVKVKENGEMHCTDGWRLHTYKPEQSMEPGLYEIIKNTKKEIILSKFDTTMQFPDSDGVIPNTDGWEKVAFKYNEPAFVSYTEAVRVLSKNKTINYSLFEDVITEVDYMVHKENEFMVVFTGPDTLAVVMLYKMGS
jgi:hypothetical protein